MKSRIYIEAFNCVTSTGENPETFWKALYCGQTGIKKADIQNWPSKFKTFWFDQNHEPIACTIEKKSISALETLSQTLSSVARAVLNPDSTTGIIFASTKGAIEDYVWQGDFAAEVDPLNLVLTETIKKLGVHFNYQQVVSNSCASSHAAFALAKQWIESGACSKVLVIAGDLIGPFIHTGFQSLKALSVESAKPFQENRDGLVLGEAFTAVVLSNKKAEFELLDCQIFNEAHTVTGASPEGRGLLKCISNLAVGNVKPDFAIAHATATTLNDQIEDHVMSSAQKHFENLFFITGTKWSVGHTLGASGSVDLIAAIMSLHHQKLFSLHADTYNENTKATNYVFTAPKEARLKTALVTSLGFGGTNGALMVQKVGE